MTDRVVITISGPVQCGKTIVLDRIAWLLESCMGLSVETPDLRASRNDGSVSSVLSESDMNLLMGTIWRFREVATPAQGDDIRGDIDGVEYEVSGDRGLSVREEGEVAWELSEDLLPASSDLKGLVRAIQSVRRAAYLKGFAAGMRRQCVETRDSFRRAMGLQSVGEPFGE